MLQMRRCIIAVLATIALCGTGAAQDPGRSVIRLSYIPGNFALPVLVGIEHGIFGREGLYVSAVPTTEEGTLMRSLNQGGTDFAIGSQSLLLSIAQNKLDIRVVAVAAHSRKIELVVPVWDTTTKSIADLKGKTVLVLNGVHNFDAVPELYRAFALSKLRLSDVSLQFIDLVNLQAVMDPRFKPQYVQRKVAGIFMFSEYTAAYVDQKKARVVVSNEDFSKLIGRIGSQPLLASKLVLDREPKLTERFVRAWTRTMAHMADKANHDAIVRVLQIYYLRQYGFLLKKELADGYVDAVRYDEVVWSPAAISEITINAKALSAGRNLLFANIKEADKRPFKDVPDVDAYFEMSYVKKALEALDLERKANAAKPAVPPGAPADNPKKAEVPDKDGNKPDAPSK